MNDYAHGALEALARTLGLLEETEDIGRIRRQLGGTKDDLLAGVSINLSITRTSLAFCGMRRASG
jgi:hypothetical protein